MEQETIEARPCAQTKSPIKYLTENGFSIMRLCELERSTTDSASECHFIVRNPNGWERGVTVEFDDQAIALVQRQRSREPTTPLSLSSSFWLHCAERHLAAYLWENDAYPPSGRLMVDYPSAEELQLAARWND